MTSGHRLGDDEVAGARRAPARAWRACARAPRPPRAPRAARGSRPGGLDADAGRALPAHPQHPRVLVDDDAAVDQPRPQTERQAPRVHGRAVGRVHPAPEDRRVAVLAHLRGREVDEPVAHAELVAPPVRRPGRRRRAPPSWTPAARRRAGTTRRRPAPRTSARSPRRPPGSRVRARAPAPRRGGRAARSRLSQVPWQKPPLRPLGPCPHRSASSRTMRASGACSRRCQAHHMPV